MKSDAINLQKSSVEAEGEGSRYIFSNADFNEVSGVLTVAGEPVTVEPMPLRLLAMLLRRANEIVTRDELFERLWAGHVTVDHVLANAMSKLRKALGDEAGARIVNIPRVGYRLNGPVQRVAAAVAHTGLAIGHPVPGREGFVLERPLSPAGHSMVWLARHAELGQVHVFKFADNPGGLSAIQREYTLYCLLQAELGPRDDFARVLDTQFLASPYFLECEYGGSNLLEWADESNRLSGMLFQERLSLFLAIARPVAAAHSVGVIHKDLKPTNVLIAGEPERWHVRLTDFGSGRLLDPSRLDGRQLTARGLTQAASLPSGSEGGTPMYLAPELLAGQSATIQTDVFALGLLLYQLIVGDLRRPLASGWEREVQHPLLCDDIRCATDGRPHERLQSVADLVERLSTLQARTDEVEAHQRAAEMAAETALQLQHARTRRPWMMASFASLLVGLVTSLELYRQAAASRDEARLQEAKARAISGFLTKDILQSADVTGSGAQKSLPMGSILQRASRSAADHFSGLPGSEAEIRVVLGELYFKISSFKQAEAEFRSATELFSKAGKKQGMQTVEARYALARALLAQSKLDGWEVATASDPIRLARHAQVRIAPQRDWVELS